MAALHQTEQNCSVDAQVELAQTLQDMGNDASHLSGAIQGGLRPWAMDVILCAKQCVVIGKGKGRHAARMVEFKRRAEEVAVMEVDEEIGQEQRVLLVTELRYLLNGSFRHLC